VLSILDAGDGSSPWAEACYRQADRVVVVADARSRPGLGPAARSIAALAAQAHAPQVELVLLQHGAPRGTAAWRRLDGVAAHHHVGAASNADLDRVARHLLGRSVALVLGGGGARAFAHVGVHRALTEAGVPIDRVAGSSIGAVVAAQVALGWSSSRMHEVNREEWNRARIHRRYTVPRTALLSVRTAVPMFERMFGDADLEDTRIPCALTTVDLTACRLAVHERGPITRWVRASASPPGIWPPVVDDGGSLHVDGGVLDNLPVEAARLPSVGRIVTVNVSPPQPLAGRVPSLPRILYRTATVTSLSAQLSAADRSDLYVEPPVTAVGLTDYKLIDRTVEAGYHEAVRRLDALDPPATTWA
jgi:NTE family protein